MRERERAFELFFLQTKTLLILEWKRTKEREREKNSNHTFCSRLPRPSVRFSFLFNLSVSHHRRLHSSFCFSPKRHRQFLLNLHGPHFLLLLDAVARGGRGRGVAVELVELARSRRPGKPRRHPQREQRADPQRRACFRGSSCRSCRWRWKRRRRRQLNDWRRRREQRQQRHGQRQSEGRQEQRQVVAGARPQSRPRRCRGLGLCWLLITCCPRRSRSPRVQGGVDEDIFRAVAAPSARRRRRLVEFDLERQRRRPRRRRPQAQSSCCPGGRLHGHDCGDAHERRHEPRGQSSRRKQQQRRRRWWWRRRSERVGKRPRPDSRAALDVHDQKLLHAGVPHSQWFSRQAQLAPAPCFVGPDSRVGRRSEHARPARHRLGLKRKKRRGRAFLPCFTFSISCFGERKGEKWNEREK